MANASIPCPACGKELCVNNGRQVKSNRPRARAFCRSCDLDTGWIDGSSADAQSSATKTVAAKNCMTDDRATS